MHQRQDLGCQRSTGDIYDFEMDNISKIMFSVRCCPTPLESQCLLFTIPTFPDLQMHSLNTDFIVPLESKLEAEEKSLTVRSLISCAVYGIIISINFNGYMVGHAKDVQAGKWKEGTGM